MRVTHCVPIFSELTQTFVHELVVNLRDHEPGVATRVLTWRRRNAAERPFDPVDVVDPPTPAAITRIRIARALPEAVERWLFPPTRFERDIAACLRRSETDLVHAHFGPTAVLVGRACRLAGVPLLVTFRGRDASAKLRKARWRRLYRRTLARAAAVSCVSGDLRRQLAAVLPARLDARVVLGGKQARRLPYRDPPPPRGRLVSVGRLIEKKGHADAIRALARVRARGIAATLTIIGEGPLRAELECEIERHGLGAAVTLTGALPYEQVVARLQDADILVAANRVAANGDCEGVPNVVKEAQLVGLPLAATRHGGIPQAVPETARADLVEEGDVEALADRIAGLCAAPAADLAAVAHAGHEHVLATFDPLAEVRAYRALYASVLAAAGPGRG